MKQSSTAKARRHEFDADDGRAVDLTKLKVVGRGRLAGKLRHALESLRVASGLTQAEMATRMGVTQAQVSKIEAGQDPRISTLRRYAKALGGELDLVILFDGRRCRVAL